MLSRIFILQEFLYKSNLCCVKASECADANLNLCASLNAVKLSPQKQQGFTLLELMVTIAIVGILAAVAIPSYQDYARRATYSEVVSQTAPYKLGVISCYQSIGTLTGCDAGQNEVPTAVIGGKGVVATVGVKNGTITVTPNDTKGIKPADTYILTPTEPEVGGNSITWKSSGGGVDKGYAK